MDSTLRLKARPPVEDEIENWDDDDFLIDGDDLAFPSLTNSANISSNRRDSQSSFRSDFESVHGEEEKQVHLPGNDEKSTLDAIAAAAKAGIPIPKNVPPSALMGGTIKRLGGRKIKKIIQEDWVDDLEFPDTGQSLQIKTRDGAQFPEVLRQVSNSAQPSPSKPPKDASMPVPEEQKDAKSASSSFIDLERFRDADDDDDFFGDGAETIKVSKKRVPPKPLSLITSSPTPRKPVNDEDDFEKDLELPEDGRLKLSARRDIPKTPTLTTLLDDLDWAEGSLGTRFGGTRRDAQSTRSSSVSAFSPSISSSITAESEDETFDGLIIPSGPIDFGERLKRRRQSRSPARILEEPIMEEPAKEELVKPKSAKEERDEEKEDFLAGLEIGDGQGHQTLQPIATQSIGGSQIHKQAGHSFPSSSADEFDEYNGFDGLNVSESGGPIPRAQSRRSLSRIGHSAHSSVTSVSSVTTPPTPSSTQTVTPSTPRRRELGQITSTTSLREPTTTSAQLLRLKRSMPSMHAQQSPARPPPPPTRTYERPPSRTEPPSRTAHSVRPKTPVERMRSSESAAALARKAPVPFLPAGASAAQSHNINAKGSRTFRRHDSDTSIEFRPHSRAVSRSTIRSPSPRRYRPTEKVTTDGAWGKLSMPRRVRNFGDGHELDAFDDLPTSSQAEAKFLKQPVSAKSQTRIKNHQNVVSDRTVTPSPSTPYSSRADYVPSFARDTAASRIARETVLAQRNPSGVLAPLTAQLVKGMWYNPETFRWEGNDNALSAFDVPASSPSTASVPPHLMRDQNATPRPALITNIGATKGVQVVGGMVFDPQNMCWLKLGPPSKSGESDPLDGFNAIEDEEDVFKDIPDLEERTMASSDGGNARVSDINQEWPVGEEFDVGPEFVRRQREEEERWRKKCHVWIDSQVDRGDAWKWAIRDIVSQSLAE
ncbi:ccaa9ddd-3bde-4c7b-ab6a-2088234df3de [Thermothielavioides terrestris]|uniref:Ccaa9ddd-3bde-4c7b-ab6a-2088234df3de n=1 Tax=Thermothielavioides terrestris TaxID=2587410 RepID=A0A3S4AW35_9PEZI|nr:ccaa9ddd-3bde-4c7b-ab6a-2088234df3de [Thermothielavioides terrestris]